MPSQETIEQIKRLAAEVNRVSEEYQLIHATFAIEKLFEEKIQENTNREIARIRAELLNETDKEVQERLFKQVSELKTDARKKVRILVEYIPQIQENSSRTTRTQANTFIIVLPKCMEDIRNQDGKIDFDRMRKLRKLMAHELGHIVLHSGILYNCEGITDEEKEIEADMFADILIQLRKQRNAEIYAEKHFEKI